MLEIRNLHFRYSRRGPMVLDGVDLDLKDGEIGILGAGKAHCLCAAEHSLRSFERLRHGADGAGGLLRL